MSPGQVDHSRESDNPKTNRMSVHQRKGKEEEAHELDRPAHARDGN